MKALPQHTLPLATTAPFTRWSHAPALRPGAWGSAWEQANRFSGEALGSAASQVQSASAVPLLTDRRAAMPRKESAQPVASAAAVDASPSHFIPLEGRQSALCQPAAVSVSIKVGAEADDAPQPQPARRAASHANTSPAAGEASPVHVHLEQHADGTAVWLGVSARVDAGVASSLLASLRQALPQGLVLARLTCNGRSLYDRLALHQENP